MPSKTQLKAIFGVVVGACLGLTACATQPAAPSSSAAPTSAVSTTAQAQTPTSTSPKPSTPSSSPTPSPAASSRSGAPGGNRGVEPSPSFSFNVPPPADQRPDNPINHPMSASWQQQTLEQISAFTGVPVGQYQGLEMAKTYAATNDSGFTYWVATSVIPGESSEAKKSVSGAGSYFLVHYDQDKNVDVFPVGKAGYEAANRCAAAKLPDSIRQMWGWAPSDCPPF